MKRNPTIKRWWKNVDSSDSEERVTTMVQFYSVLNTYNEAAILMRAYFRRHPLESTATYKQNLTYLGPFLNEIAVDTCDSERGARACLCERKHKSKSSGNAVGLGTARWSASSSARWSS
jgi:hypothetical protein